MSELRGTYGGLPTGQDGADLLVPISEYLADDDWYAGRFDDDGDLMSEDCSHCGGEGYIDECDDPLGCTSKHLGGRFLGPCPCGACGGSGLAKDQTIW